jgi:hypothetical protein
MPGGSRDHRLASGAPDLIHRSRIWTEDRAASAEGPPGLPGEAR